MKNALIYALMIVSTVGGLGSAQAEDVPQVVAEKITTVGFAPEPFRGIYRLQILRSGEVRDVDNHGKITKLATLEPQLIAKLEARIHDITSTELVEPTQSPCMDAPGQRLAAYKQTGPELVIWRNEGCHDFDAVDWKTRSVADSVNALFRGLTSIEQ